MSKIAFFLTLISIQAFAITNVTTKPNSAAPTGGVFTRNIEGEPPTIHPIMAKDGYSTEVQSYVLESLARRNSNTAEWEPLLAEKWEMSKDGKSYTFTLRKGLKFQDGTPIQAEDVKFSYEAIFEKEYGAAELIPYYENIEKVEVIDPLTIKFTLKNTYFMNFNVIAGLTLIPKSVYGDVAKSKKLTKELVGSGPYKLEKFERGQKIVLRKHAAWWGNAIPEYKGENNFDTVILRFVNEKAVSFEMAKKGELDYEILTPEFYEKKAQGEPWGTGVFKNKAQNFRPKKYNFVGWNFRNPIFQEKSVRVAMAHLMNREEMNKKFRYGMSLLVPGPGYVGSKYSSDKVKPILFDVKKAQDLLAKAGWKDADKNGILEKDLGGKKTEMKFTLIHANKDFEKYFTMYKEDLKKAGVEMEIKYLEWNSFLKLLDDGNFDAVALSWGGVIDSDPKQIWHSSSATSGGSNFIHYKNPEVDKLMEQARFEVDKKKRMEGLKKVYEMIAEDAPYAFMFNEKYDFYANTKRMGKPGETFGYEVGHGFWWTLSN